MKHLSFVLLFLLCFLSANARHQLFFYCPDATQGLHVAHKDTTADGLWEEIGQLFASDYGPWGEEKRMYSPYVIRAKDGTWRAVFQVNDSAPCFAATYSDDLVVWRPQDYPRMGQRGCHSPIIRTSQDGFDIYFASNENGMRVTHASFDFRQFSPDEAADIRFKIRKDRVEIDGKGYEGQIFEVSDDEAARLIDFHRKQQADNLLWQESMKDDANTLMPYLRSADCNGRQAVAVTLTADSLQEKSISDKLIGIFFEDINFAADGGLYAELIQNGDFEYSASDHRGWDALTAWQTAGHAVIGDSLPLSANNPHYAVVTTDTLFNMGFDGVPLKKGGHYVFSFFVRNIDRGKKRFSIGLGEGTRPVTIVTKSQSWQHYTVTLVALKDCDNARLCIVPQGKGRAAIDMVSLMPEDTYKGHGLRRDIAEAIAALHPKFVRFPGGCMSHGQGIGNIYHWQHTIGVLQDRKPDINIWNYHQSRRLGFYEYFQWCEDMGAEPLPVLAAGVPCQNSRANADGYAGQQAGIALEDMPAYIDEILHLIEWANGDPATSEWARVRADAGHPAPFHLKYIGIGNEDLVSTAFEERCRMIAEAVRRHYPDIQICGTVGPFHSPSSDYVEGWKYAKENSHLFDMVDEHYYESTGWFLHNQHYYDSYDRTAPKVYLGEYASRTRTVESALAEAIHLCNVERNGDVVVMTSYAPLLCNIKHQNWNPDLIYFENTSVTLTPSYHTQRLFSTCSGDRYIPSVITPSPDGIAADEEHQQQALRRIAASIVRDSKTGHRYLKVINALPMPLSVTLQGISLPASFTVEGFCGHPTDKTATLISQRQHSGMLMLEPYSVMVIGF